MFRHRKLLILKRLNALVRMSITKQQYINALKGSTDEVGKQADDQNDDYDDSLDSRLMDIPFELIHFMSPKQRRKLQEQYPNMPPYIFMNDKEKIKFFQKKGREYKEKLNSTPKRCIKTKKIVKFKDSYDVRPFRDTHKVSQISETKSFKDTYRCEHYSS